MKISIWKEFFSIRFPFENLDSKLLESKFGIPNWYSGRVTRLNRLNEPKHCNEMKPRCLSPMTSGGRHRTDLVRTERIVKDDQECRTGQ